MAGRLLLVLLAAPVRRAAVTWRCSTEGSTWQERPLTASAAAAPAATTTPRAICTAANGINCYGNDISQPTGSTAASCCASCKALKGCFAWTFDSTPSHKPTCNMKSRCSGNGTTRGTKWVTSGFTPAPPPGPPLVNLTVSTSDVLHQMDGFGGCFNEKGWDALSALSEAQRTKVMEAMFGSDGLRWGINRMPIGSSDFADNYYSLDDTIGDLPINHLNLSRDNSKLLPYIKAAMAVNPHLRVWGSPWTGPTWMKDSAPQMPKNEGCGSLSPDPKLRAAYALYLAKAAKSYIAAGLKFEHLAIQNEPNQGSTWNGHSCGDSYPKMHWTGDQLHTFLRDHLGPTFAEQGLADTVGIFLGALSATPPTQPE
jgi:hypothetical protein